MQLEIFAICSKVYTKWELLAEYQIIAAIVNDIYDFNLKSGKKRKTNLYKVLMRAMVSSKNGFYILQELIHILRSPNLTTLPR